MRLRGCLWVFLSFVLLALPAFSGQPLIFKSAADGNVQAVKSLLAYKPDYATQPDKDTGNTALHYAAQAGHADVVRLLLANGANANARNQDGQTPLHMAVWKVYYRTFDALIEAGAEINAVDKRGNTPLHAAVSRNHIGLIRYLLAHGASTTATNADGRTPWDLAVAQHKTSIIPELEDSTLWLVHQAERDHLTPLHVAVAAGNTAEAARLAGKHPEWLNAPSGADGITPLGLALQNGQRETAARLLELGADPNGPNGAGDTPLHLLAGTGRLEDITLLLAHRADPNRAEGSDDRQPLHWAVLAGDTAMVKALLAHGAKPEGRTHHGVTPLHLAALSGNTALCEMLITPESLNAVDENGNTPLYYATQRRPETEEVVSLLLDHCADPTIANHDGVTAEQGVRDTLEHARSSRCAGSPSTRTTRCISRCAGQGFITSPRTRSCCCSSPSAILSIIRPISATTSWSWCSRRWRAQRRWAWMDGDIAIVPEQSGAPGARGRTVEWDGMSGNIADKPMVLHYALRWKAFSTTDRPDEVTVPGPNGFLGAQPVAAGFCLWRKDQSDPQRHLPDPESNVCCPQGVQLSFNMLR